MVEQIALAEPIVIPVKEETVLTKAWFRQIIINTPGPIHPASIVAEYGPWSGDVSKDAVWRDGQGNDLAERLVIDDLWAYRAAVPELNAAYQAIITAIPAVFAYQQQQQQAAAEEEQPQ